jgi:hypothetical protein
MHYWGIVEKWGKVGRSPGTQICGTRNSLATEAQTGTILNYSVQARVQ